MFQSMKKRDFVVSLVCGCTLALTLQAGESPQQPNPDWPCEQVLVAEVPAAVVWAGPSIDGMEQVWEQDKEVESLVKQFTSPDFDTDVADAEISAFSSKLQGSEKERKLTLLFAGVIQSLNERRRKELDGIIRYAQGQTARANRLSEELDEMVRLQDDSSQAARERLALMQQEMEIKQRMFDEREAFIQHLCTRPRVIEERLGVLARTIAYYLD
ncbi:MAG: hypothetical protein B6D72_10560 [gamma proteobacterium symbiont of Ctena orbiculata]|nr:MAG: hypothetical protein DBP00_18905 [gamma proteobacterium symbiont of Ctena orbiculata]PVV11199.1 MAG: hypothetical protein B6D72_10560 [gamma proteobacterium symbiont of Ctena orbiculata]PVV14620.1 MAG: hypothetical protein B6D82_05455 [gamma proteobacterium symbiont of Ctena orbiculata]PVV18171.1 MAG: hypothetical protein B6D74_16870 [gamma proteobacterium symbiont of Ctena orbiculata]